MANGQGIGQRTGQRIGQRIGLYPGTFDPITNGHADIIGRAIKLVDRLVIGVAVNIGKAPMFSVEERVDLVREQVVHLGDSVEVLPFDSLLMHFAQDVGAGVIIRGLRAVADFEYEFQMTAMNQQLNRELETVFLMADPRHQAIASRLVKEIAQLGGNIAPFVAPSVARRLLDKVKQGRDPANRAAE
ncbi:MAG: pantetheine-phosphate adenylyltransferase [Asticcacaulis sp.]